MTQFASTKASNEPQALCDVTGRTNQLKNALAVPRINSIAPARIAFDDESWCYKLKQNSHV